MKKIDLYIIRKYLGTYFGAIILIVIIAVIFDLSEKMDEFIENEAPLKSIIMDYCLNFIPYFAVLFAPLFSFIAVIFFTSRMAYNTELIAILSSGVSFPRLLIPYFTAGIFIMVFNMALGNYVIPGANRIRFEFNERYYHKEPVRFIADDVHKQISPGVFVYLGSYTSRTNFGTKFSMERFEKGMLKSKLFAEEIRWDSLTSVWKIKNYYIRNYSDTGQTLISGARMDTLLNLSPDEFLLRDNVAETMNLQALNKFIQKMRLQGSTRVNSLLVERHKRFSFPFSTLILTLIGVSVSSRKVKGGIGMHIGIGMLISFTYILFQQFSTQFAITGAMSPFLATWLPNFLFAIVALFLYRIAPK
ncbi:MAG: LptF/LptG family permease [Bacteroidales bacterium]|nr:LptF/LptG family permease [Bacteroidales bacterium]